MKLHTTRFVDGRFGIYRKTWVSLSIAFAMVFACFFFGWLFGFKLDAPAPVTFFGYFILSVGAALLFTVPGYAKRLRKEGGELLFEATREGIKVANSKDRGTNAFPFSVKPLFFKWEDVERILLVKNVFSKSIASGGYGTLGEVMLIFLGNQENRSLVDRASNGISRSPEGDFYVSSPCSKDNRGIITEAVVSVSGGSVRPERYDKVIFDYNKDKTEYFQDLVGFSRIR